MIPYYFRLYLQRYCVELAHVWLYRVLMSRFSLATHTKKSSKFSKFHVDFHISYVDFEKSRSENTQKRKREQNTLSQKGFRLFPHRLQSDIYQSGDI